MAAHRCLSLYPPQPVSTGFSPALRPVFFRLIDALQPLDNLAPRVALLLILDICDDPRQVLGSEAYDAVAVLPVQHFAIADLVIDLM